MRNILYLIFVFGLMPCLANAQSKPKRDTSKDRSVVVAKKQKKKVEKATSNRPLVAKKSKRNASNSRKYRTVTKCSASYLTVNQNSTQFTASYLTVNQNSTQFTETLLPFGGRLTFDVQTDGKEWNVWGVPSWCTMTKSSNGFILEYDENISHGERKDWLVVKCDSKEVRVNISQLAALEAFAANIDNLYLKHNVYSSSLGGLCLEIHAIVTITGAAGELCSIDAYITDEKGNYINAKSSYPLYMLSSANPAVCTSTKISPITNKTQSYDVVCYLPNNALDLRKTENNLYCRVIFWCSGKGYLTDLSRNLYISTKSKHGVVTTKDYW